MKPNLVQLARLVGNPDVYALQNKDGTWTPVRKPLSRDVLFKHLNRGWTVGTYVGHGDSVAHTLVFDLDSGADAVRDTDRIVAALEELGVPRLHYAVEYSGRKGYHVWVLLQEDRPNAELRRVGRAVLALAGLNCEVFPKQDEVRDLGNLVKLPGGVHQVSGKPNDFVSAAPVPMPVARWLQVVESLGPEVKAQRSGPVDSRFPCLEHIQQGVQEGSRNNDLFQLATMVRRAGLDEANTALVVERTNALGDALDGHEVESILDSSRVSGPLCTDSQRALCGELCIKERTSGLYARPGQLRHASIGSPVVVTLTGKSGGLVVLEHDDLNQPAKGGLRETT